MIGLLFGAGSYRTVFGNSYGSIELDATLKEEHVWNSRVTRYPVEDGTEITDHVIKEQDELRIEGFISDHPLIASPTVQAYLSGIVGVATTENRVQSMFELLITLRDKKEPIIIFTKHRLYVDMVITDLRVPRERGDGESIKFVMKLVNIKRVSTQLVDSPVKKRKGTATSKKVKEKTQEKVNSGEKQTETPKETSEIRSIIRNVLGI